MAEQTILDMCCGSRMFWFNKQDTRAVFTDDRTAQELLLDVMPSAVTRFNRVTASLNALLIDIRKHFPDACYYSASDTLCLMLGDSHNVDNQPQRELVVTVTNKPMIGGGDW